MSRLTFEQFKTIFEFGIEVAGVGTAIGAVWYRFDVIRSWWDVVRGRATRAEQTLATQTLRDAGPTGQMMAGRIARGLDRHGHHDAAERVREVEREVQLEYQQSLQPEQMV